MSLKEDIDEFDKKLKKKISECDEEIERLKENIKKVEQRKIFYIHQRIKIGSLWAREK